LCPSAIATSSNSSDRRGAETSGLRSRGAMRPIRQARMDESKPTRIRYWSKHYERRNLLIAAWPPSCHLPLSRRRPPRRRLRVAA
jgi:hypothetical protein